MGVAVVDVGRVGMRNASAASGGFVFGFAAYCPPLILIRHVDHELMGIRSIFEHDLARRQHTPGTLHVPSPPGCVIRFKNQVFRPINRLPVGVGKVDGFSGKRVQVFLEGGLTSFRQRRKINPVAFPLLLLFSRAAAKNKNQNQQ
jgi:hypothetical protein